MSFDTSRALQLHVALRVIRNLFEHGEQWVLGQIDWTDEELVILEMAGVVVVHND